MKACPRCASVFRDDLSFCGYDGAELVARPPSDPLIGMVINDSYRLRARIGAGGFGLVYEATHERLPMRVAVKLLLPSRRNDAAFVARFRLEVATQALFQHPNIVRVLDHGCDDRVGYFATLEHLTGKDLAQVLDSHTRLGILEILAVLDQTAAALQAVHASGHVHGDVKAENLFLADDAARPEGFCLKLLDFGLVRDALAGDAANAALSGRNGRRPEQPTALGSPATMAPEVIRGAQVDFRGDVYSLGAVAYELLSGEILFASNDLHSMLQRIMHDVPPAPSSLRDGHWIPPAVDALVLQMLQKDPDTRPASIAQVREALAHLRPEIERAWAAAFLTVPESPETRPGRRTTDGHCVGARTRPLMLAVDDDAVIRSILERLAIGAGWDCQVQDSGASALEWLRQNPPPDMIMTDVLMPGIDGLTLAAAIRSDGFTGPVVFCTGVVSEQLRLEMDKVRASWCLDKVSELHRVPQLLHLTAMTRHA